MSTGSEQPLYVQVPVDAVAWHDLENGAEWHDLSLWSDLAARFAKDTPVLDLGCGTGRVALHLAREGYEVVGVDSDPALVGAFNERAGASHLPAQALVGDVRTLALRRLFSLVIAPMQLIELLGDTTERLAALHRIAEHLAPRGHAGFAIVEPGELDPPPGKEWSDPEVLPDVREIHDWVFSSRPLLARPGARGIVVQRFRERVSPRGEVTEETHSEVLDLIDADRLEEEAGLAGLTPVERRRVDAGYGFAPSTAIVMEKR